MSSHVRPSIYVLKKIIIKILRENIVKFQLLPTLRSLMGEEKAEFQRRQAQNTHGKLALIARATLSRQEGTK